MIKIIFFVFRKYPSVAEYKKVSYNMRAIHSLKSIISEMPEI